MMTRYIIRPQARIAKRDNPHSHRSAQQTEKSRFTTGPQKFKEKASVATAKQEEKKPRERPEKTSSGGDMKLFIAIGLFALLSAGATAGAVYMVNKTQLANIKIQGGGHGDMPLSGYFPGPTYNLGDFVVNLGSADERRYLKASLAVQFGLRENLTANLKGEELHAFEEKFHAENKHLEPGLKDKVISVLSQQTPATLTTPEGKARVKELLVTELNKAMHGPDKRVLEVYITDFIIQ